MNGYLTAMRRYVEFSGRSSRSEFWFFVLFYIIIYIIAAIIDAFVFGRRGQIGILTSIVALAHLIPLLSVTVRRLHDIDRTGWWLLGFILVPSLLTLIAVIAAGGSIAAMLMSGQEPGTAAMTGLAGFGATMLIVILLDFVIWIVALVFYCTPGTAGPNRYGPQPG